MSEKTVIMDFSGVRSEAFQTGAGNFISLDCCAIDGTDCYCDGDAASAIRRMLEPFGHGGVHFIDTGNYHYLTRFWTEKIRRPYSLLLFDHHPDLQEPRFEGVLSCGGWVLEMLRSDPFLRDVVMVGVDDSLLCVTEPFRDRVRVIGEDEAAVLPPEAIAERLKMAFPAYVSIDKDVLCCCCARTNWDQGSLTVERLTAIMDALVKGCGIIGADICGGLTVREGATAEDFRINALSDAALLEFLSERISEA